MDNVRAWYFCTDERKLRYEDKRAIVDGETLTVEGEPVLCKWGLHASESLVDALSYAPGAVLCRVEVGGTVLRGDDKLVGTSRKVVWSIPSAIVLPMAVEFARWCADRAESAAWSAADAARSAHAAAADAWSAADAARSAHAAAADAWSAANAARSAAAWSAVDVWSVAWSAANAARSAEKSAQNKWWVDQLVKAGYSL
jgi:hypothetical protein